MKLVSNDVYLNTYDSYTFINTLYFGTIYTFHSSSLYTSIYTESFIHSFIHSLSVHSSLFSIQYQYLLITPSCHVVKKAIPYYDPVLNRTIRPITSNAYKMQYYLSDIFPQAHSFQVLVVPRDDFIPLKNPSF